MLHVQVQFGDGGRCRLENVGHDDLQGDEVRTRTCSLTRPPPPPRLTVPRLSFFPLLSREVVSSVLPLSSLCLPRAAAVRSAYPSK